MGRPTTNDDDVEAFHLEHGREGVASIGVGLVLVEAEKQAPMMR